MRRLRKRRRKPEASTRWAAAYNDIRTWQLQHQLAHWRARAIALTAENRLLREAVTKSWLGRSRSPSTSSTSSDSSNSEEGELGLNVSEEMLEFLRRSAEHRLARDRAKLEATADLTVPPEPSIDPAERPEALQLYGNHAAKIAALETAVQLNYDKHVDTHDPVYWPNIPLNM